jgi:hypothetical protein
MNETRYVKGKLCIEAAGINRFLLTAHPSTYSWPWPFSPTLSIFLYNLNHLIHYFILFSLTFWFNCIVLRVKKKKGIFCDLNM